MAEAERAAAIDAMAEAYYDHLDPAAMRTSEDREAFESMLDALLQYLQLREQSEPSEPVVNEGVLDRPQDEEWSELEKDISVLMWLSGFLGEGAHPHDAAQFARTFVSDLAEYGWTISGGGLPIHPESSELGNASPKG